MEMGCSWRKEVWTGPEHIYESDGVGSLQITTHPHEDAGAGSGPQPQEREEV